GSNGDKNPVDPGKGNSGHVLVAVSEVRLGTVLSTTVSGCEGCGTGEPEDPAKGNQLVTNSVNKGFTYVRINQAPWEAILD
nr:hypothetical protein [Tanacetum cinerariifolium]